MPHGLHQTQTSSVEQNPAELNGPGESLTQSAEETSEPVSGKDQKRSPSLEGATDQCATAQDSTHQTSSAMSITQGATAADCAVPVWKLKMVVRRPELFGGLGVGQRTHLAPIPATDFVLVRISGVWAKAHEGSVSKRVLLLGKKVSSKLVTA